MKTLEYHYGYDWRDRLLNALAIDAAWVESVAVAWDSEGVYFPGSRSLFYNGFVFLRLSFPFGVFLHLKPMRNLRLQAGFGWALNGRFKLILRAQSDESAAAGVHGPNLDQAIEWDRGTA